MNPGELAQVFEKILNEIPVGYGVWHKDLQDPTVPIEIKKKTFGHKFTVAKVKYNEEAKKFEVIDLGMSASEAYMVKTIVSKL